MLAVRCLVAKLLCKSIHDKFKVNMHWKQAVSEHLSVVTGPVRRLSQAAGPLTLDTKQPFDPPAGLACLDTSPDRWLSRWIQKTSEPGLFERTGDTLRRTGGSRVSCVIDFTCSSPFYLAPAASVCFDTLYYG